jgi:hypothetical protein
MTEPWNLTEAQRLQLREAHAETKRARSTPGPGEPQCEADGVRDGPDGPGGTEHYWTCTAPGTVDVDGTLMCEDHAGERGYGPKQEEYGYDPDDGRTGQ